MFENAIRQYSVHQPAARVQKPLQHKPAAANLQKTPESNQRKLDRTLSSSSKLKDLPSGVFLLPDDIDDDENLNFDVDEPPAKPTTPHPSPLKKALSETTYNSIPAAEPTTAPPLSSSATVEWSSSPQEHFHPPPTRKPTKRAKLPWIDKEGNDTSAARQPDGSFTPLPKDRPNRSPYPWNQTASAMKDGQKEVRKRKREATTVVADSAATTLSSKKKIPVPFLSEEQKVVLRTVVNEGKSVFFTGSAGTGKSVLMRQIIENLKAKFRQEPDRVAVTASTGLAACNIEGMTLHGFAGIGLAKDAAPELIKKIKRNQKSYARWMRTKVLIIDEVSMVDGDLFDKLEQIARAIKGNGRPFGGIQVVLTGDFFQLPPVPERNKSSKFCFAAQTWSTVIEHTILLNHVFRQKDPEFASILNELRLGKLSPNASKFFKALSRPLSYEDALDATELFSTKNEVDRANKERMDRLSGELFRFRSHDSGTADPQTVENQLKSCIAPPLVELKKGAQVMLVKNIDEQLVNGTLGQVISFIDESMFSFYKSEEAAYLEATGGGLDNETIEKARKKLKAFRNKDQDGQTNSAVVRYPMVRFFVAANQTRDLLCMQEEWRVESPKGEALASRKQIPLILAWALSVHKAQGQTLPRVKVDLGKTFEKGQAYVALSRAVEKDGLQVVNFEPRKVMAHPEVAKFYAGLVDVNSINAKKNATPTNGMSAQAYERRFVDLDADEEAEKEISYAHA